ncbi:MAG: DUF308 domain-containing protein [Methanobacteriaceae archaeon]
MRNIVIGLILIVLGLIVIFFPILGVIPFSLITGLTVSVIGIGLLLASAFLIKGNKVMGIMALIIGIIAISLGIGFIVNPGIFTFVTAIFLFIIGLFLVVLAIITIINNYDRDIMLSIIPLILGIIFIILATFVSNPYVLGILIGICIIIAGFLMLFRKDEVTEITFYKKS